MHQGAKELHLVVEPVVRAMSPGLKARLRGYNGQSSGPTIEVVEVVEGDRVRIHKSRHTMNATGHDAPTTIGVDHRHLVLQVTKPIRNCMVMGERGLADTAEPALFTAEGQDAIGPEAPRAGHRDHGPQTWRRRWRSCGALSPHDTGNLAEAVRFELTGPCEPPVFKTGAIDHSATLPLRSL